MSLEKAIDHAAEHLPSSWSIRIDVERYSGSVTLIRPDGSEIDLHDGESDMAEQVMNAVKVAHDESTPTPT